jgi:predicted DNA binding protein
MSHRNEDSAHSPVSEQSADGPMVVFEVAVPGDAFGLATALEEFPEIIVEFERIVPTGEGPLLYLWVSGEDTPAFREAVRSDPQVGRFERLSAFDEGALYALRWTDAVDGLLQWVTMSPDDVALLHAEGEEGEWTLKLRFPSRDRIGAFRAFCDDHDIPLRVVRLYDLEDPKLGQYNLTRKQREALLRALDLGYFEVPRTATLADVAETLDISAKSVSERLRRGQTNLVSNSLAIGRPTGIGLGEQ